MADNSGVAGCGVCTEPLGVPSGSSTDSANVAGGVGSVGVGAGSSSHQCRFLAGRAAVVSNPLSKTGNDGLPLGESSVATSGGEFAAQLGAVSSLSICVDLLDLVGFIDVTEDVGSLDLVLVSAGVGEVVSGGNYRLSVQLCIGIQKEDKNARSCSISTLSPAARTVKRLASSVLAAATLGTYLTLTPEKAGTFPDAELMVKLSVGTLESA